MISWKNIQFDGLVSYEQRIVMNRYCKRWKTRQIFQHQLEDWPADPHLIQAI